MKLRKKRAKKTEGKLGLSEGFSKIIEGFYVAAPWMVVVMVDFWDHLRVNKKTWGTGGRVD